MVARQNPGKVAELAQANKAWGNLVRVEDAVVRAGPAEGRFTSQGFQEAVRRNDPRAGHKGYARNEAPMQETADVMSKLGHNPNPHVPYAALKTASLLPASYAAASMAGPAAAAPFLGLFGTYNSASQKAIAHLLASRPELVQQLGQAMRPGKAGYRGGAMGSIPLFSQGQE
jgi:hypothetical protein